MSSLFEAKEVVFVEIETNHWLSRKAVGTLHVIAIKWKQTQYATAKELAAFEEDMLSNVICSSINLGQEPILTAADVATDYGVSHKLKRCHYI